MQVTLPTTRADAKAAGAMFYQTGRPCAKGHDAKRRTCSGACEGCYAEYVTGDAVKEKRRAYQREHAASDAVKEKRRAYLREYRKTPTGRAKMRADRAVYRKTPVGRSKLKAAVRRYEKTEMGRAASAARCSARRMVARVSGSPAETRDVRGFYVMARRVSKCLGIRHEVDHVHPIAGKGFCGLHVPWNLRVIPRGLNLRKGNRLEECAKP